MHPKNISLIEAEFSLSFDGTLMGQVQAGGETSLSQVNNIFIKLLPAILSFTGAFSAFILYHLQHPSLPLAGILVQLVPAFGRSLYFKTNANVPPISPSPPRSFPLGKGAREGGSLLLPLGESEGGADAGGSHFFYIKKSATLPKEGLFLINLTNNKIGKNIYAFLNGKYFFDVIYNHFFIQRGLNLGYNISKEIDRGAIELLGPYGLSNYFYNAGKNLAKLDTGVITTYSLYITIALISLLFILFSPALELTTNYLSSNSLAGSSQRLGSYSRFATGAGGDNNPQSLEEVRLFIIYITSALIVLSSYPPVLILRVKD
jgi:hypothetical protein